MQGTAREASLQHHPAHRDLLFLLLASGSEAPPHSAWQVGVEKGEGAGSMLQGRRRPSFGTATPWPLATSVILLVHIWFHTGKKRPAVQAKQTPQPQDFALRSPGVIQPAQSPLCSTKQGSVCALGFSFVLPLWPFTAQCHHPHFFPDKQGPN